MIQGSVNENSGWFIPPTIIIDPPFDAKVMQEETFGPVMTLNEFDDINELITKINHQNEYGLSASIFTKNKLNSKVLEVAKVISEKSNLSIKIGKKTFYKQLEMPLKKAYAYTSKMMTLNMMSMDAREGISAFLEKRKPNWKNK